MLKKRGGVYILVCREGDTFSTIVLLLHELGHWFFSAILVVVTVSESSSGLAPCRGRNSCYCKSIDLWSFAF